ncbi:MAG: DUF2393 domain-containing protein [Bryobacteraceae bacterium]|nr:DUF2393 domain-containing protein [Bryobacteraceae bacterium]
MTAEIGASQDRKRPEIPIGVFIILGLIVLVGAGFWYLERQSRNVPQPKVLLTPEAKAYVRYLKLDEVQMKATEAFLKQTLVEITGKITNTGDRRLRQVDINCIFYDPYGQVVLRERVSIVRQRTGGLNPGETKDFRLPFDNIPESWNQAMPQMVIAQILFE